LRRQAGRPNQNRMNVLLIGSGGREHALANALTKSPQLTRLYVAPGNPGIAAVAEGVVLDTADHGAVLDFCRLMKIGLVVVGPEQPLVEGIADALRAAGIPCFGPSRAAARLEGSKGFTKDLCRQAGIPTAAYGRFSDKAAALGYLERVGAPIVVKADGLAAGKGVIVAATIDEARAAVEACFGGEFGKAGAEVVIEEFLEGEEASFFALCDGERAVALGSAQDHKRVGDGDTGPNTGGMGAYSPATIVTPAIEKQVMTEIVRPTLQAMRDAGTPFTGVLFAGLMIGKKGPQLIEFNVRFGDPETQVLLPRVDADLLALLLNCARGKLVQKPVPLKPLSALTVVVAARGYPAKPVAGGAIRGLDRVAAVPGVVVTQAGTKRVSTELVASGGRVLNVTGLGPTLREARERAYAGVAALDFPDGFVRKDIGFRAL
jgi:phosphoribosylamine--glycine ligase